MPRFDLTDLDRDITKEKIKTAVMQLPPEKARSPDGYINRSLQQEMLAHGQG
jgi:hypothetical protein